MQSEKISISTPYIKLSSLLKFSGAVVTGGQASELINEGLIKLNGEPCTMRGKKVVSGDVVEVDGQLRLEVIGE